VDDFFVKESRVSTHKMAHKGEGFSLADASVFAVSVEIAFEIPIFTVFKDNVEVFSRAEAVIHLYDVGGGEGLESCDLTLDLFLDVIGQFVDVNTFDGDLDSGFGLSVVDLPTGSLPQWFRFKDPIV
jgi:hypothetical protein